MLSEICNTIASNRGTIALFPWLSNTIFKMHVAQVVMLSDILGDSLTFSKVVWVRSICQCDLWYVFCRACCLSHLAWDRGAKCQTKVYVGERETVCNYNYFWPFASYCSNTPECNYTYSCKSTSHAQVHWLYPSFGQFGCCDVHPFFLINDDRF